MKNLPLLFLGAVLFLATSASGADWPQWRGIHRNGRAEGETSLAKMPAEIKPVWKISVGGGFSAPVVSGGLVVYLDERDGKEIAHALKTTDGSEVWQQEYTESFGDEWGTGPRATPIIDGVRIYVQGCNGEFRVLQLKDGKEIWKASYEKDFGVKFLGSKAREGTASRRGNNGSGVIIGDRIILPVGNTEGASLVCFDKISGKVLWKAGTDEAAYSSFLEATLAGQKQVVALTADALLGADPSKGTILWRVPLKTNAKRHAASPVLLGSDMITVNSHSFGLIAYKITKDSGDWQATEAWSNKDLKINLATPVLEGGHLYCQGAKKDYVCVDASNGKLKWSQPGFGSGQKDYASTISVGGKLLVLTEDGTLVLIAPNPEKYTELGRIQVCGNTWSHPAYSAGKLYVRDGRFLQCLELIAN
ncbi:MAG TPA: PQQ-binding-like beta-propeller repeat protein [Candidatus Saccharimonadales bacterium]|nr:PQQ-binding-like beta-propeller repeat protein [Candidatus Saccharimonadales bacterium]